MKALVAVLAIVLGVLALSLVWTNHSQVETISQLRENNSLLRVYVEEQRAVCSKLERLNQAYDRLLGSVAGWLGMKPPKGLGGPVDDLEGP